MSRLHSFYYSETSIMIGSRKNNENIRPTPFFYERASWWETGETMNRYAPRRFFSMLQLAAIAPQSWESAYSLSTAQLTTTMFVQHWKKNAFRVSVSSRGWPCYVCMITLYFHANNVLYFNKSVYNAWSCCIHEPRTQTLPRRLELLTLRLTASRSNQLS